MSSFQNPFVLPTDSYKRDVNVLGHYVQEVARYLNIRTGRPLADCEQFVRNNLKPGGRFEFKDPKTRYLYRAENGDRFEGETTLGRYINDSLKKKEIIAPTFTTYTNPEVYESVLVTYVDENVAKRSKAKKMMFATERTNPTLSAIKKVEQAGRKTSNNSLSGAHTVPSSPIYLKSAHSSLTSTCRSTSGYGNANNEKFLSGNRHYFNHHIVLNNITAIMGMSDFAKIDAVVKKYGLHVPSVEEVCAAVRHSTDFYWSEKRFFQEIADTIACLDGVQRCAFLYTGDFYHLKKHNEALVRQFLAELSEKKTGHHPNAREAFHKFPEDHLNLAVQICAKESEDTEKKLEEFRSEEDIMTVVLTCENIARVITKYADLIDCFWVTPNLPASVAHFPNSIRRSALTSDTDSTIFTVQDWVLWYKGGVSFDEEAMSVAATMIFLAASTITHVLAIMSANMGIIKKRLHTIAMKNEFKFDIFIPTQLGKHYFADISCQEGIVYSEGRRKTEIKGVQLKNSNSPREIVKDAENMMKSIMRDVRTDGKVSIMKYLKHVADVERNILASIAKGETTYLRLGSIKDHGSYSIEDPELSPFQHHTFWNTVFGPKYGLVAPPPYSTVKLSLTTDNASRFRVWLEQIPDRDLAKRLSEWMLQKDKREITTINMPMEALEAHGIPSEIQLVMNAEKIVFDLCKMYYVILEALGYFTLGDKIRRLVSHYH